tara:strand:+ start:4928 stop:6358 length:1431 start_codon:yes stop_codon:yes gene_type:complete
MSYDLNSYFQLGLDSEATPQNSLVMNTIRTPVDVQSGRAGLNKVTFKVPKAGLLTGDSMVTLQLIANPTAAVAPTSNATPNFISGALGCIQRARLVIDNKVLTDIERPSLMEIPKLYTRNTQNEVSQLNYKFMGNQFQTKVNPANGMNEFDIANTRYLSADDETADTQNVVRNRITTAAASKTYGLHLKHLGAEFLENRSLPVFLMGAREIILELFFYKDCREYITMTQGTSGDLADDSFIVNVETCELVTTHIQIPDDVAANEIAALASKPLTYPLLDNYVVKGGIATLGSGAPIPNTFRINAQNRELHKVLMVQTLPPTADIITERVAANQKALADGDHSVQIKSNGLNLYERPITNPSLFQQQSVYAYDGMALKLPYNTFNVNSRASNIPQSTKSLSRAINGIAQYFAVDFRNGNGGVFGAGSVQKQTLEIEYTVTPRSTTFPNQANLQYNTLFYLTVSKLLTIGSRMVEISF